MKNFKFSIIFTLIISTFLSCENNNPKPDYFLNHEEMVDLLTDISLAEGVRSFSVTKESYEKNKSKYEKSKPIFIEDYYLLVFEKHKITQAQLDSLNSWYVSHPNEYQEIFKEVLDNLNKMDAEEKSREKDKHKSLKISKENKAKDKTKALKLSKNKKGLNSNRKEPSELDENDLKQAE